MPTPHYTQLTQEQRYLISSQLQSGLTKPQIARCLGVSRQTVWREVNRNSTRSGYKPAQAHKQYLKHRAKLPRLSAFARAFVAHKIKQKWSPEQISHTLSAQGWIGVPSTEWIYTYVYSAEGQEQSLRADLRCQKTYRKRGYQTQDRRGKLPDRASIHERPVEVQERQRIGDIEGDTLIGHQHKGAIVSLVDRKSLYLWAKPLAHRYAVDTANACIDALKDFGAHSKAHTITFDNGKEFAQHQKIASGTGADIYFADPYHSNQRARNENTNGLIRQYVPKCVPLDTVCPKYVEDFVIELNNRPRKSLNWLTPAQVLAKTNLVALHC